MRWGGPPDTWFYDDQDDDIPDHDPFEDADSAYDYTRENF